MSRCDHSLGTVRSRPRRAAALAGLTALGLLLSGCFLSRPTVPGTDRTLPGDLGWKVVAEKQDPHMLIAADRSRCLYLDGRFDAIAEGERVFCHWEPSARGR